MVVMVDIIYRSFIGIVMILIAVEAVNRVLSAWVAYWLTNRYLLIIELTIITMK